jgi:hypothetical protein
MATRNSGTRLQIWRKSFSFNGAGTVCFPFTLPCGRAKQIVPALFYEILWDGCDNYSRHHGAAIELVGRRIGRQALVEDQGAIAIK